MPADSIAAASTRARERVAQRLASLRKGCGDDAGEGGAVAEGKRRLGQRFEREERRLHARRRREGAGADVEQGPYAHMRRQHHGQPPVIPRPGPGRHPRNDLLLQHEVHVGDRVDLLDEPEEERRRDVVRQVAGKPQLRRPSRAAARRSNSSASARCTRSSPWSAQRRVSAGTTSGSISMTSSAPAALEQRRADRAAPRSDLHQPLAGLRVDRAHDPVDRAGVVEKVLSVALLRPAHVRDRPPRAASSMASETASSRLPGSARPRPAMSSAVP